MFKLKEIKVIMNKINDFMMKRKKNKRQSLIIDNFNYQSRFDEFDHMKRNAVIRRKSLELNDDYSNELKNQSKSISELWKVDCDDSIYTNDSNNNIQKSDSVIKQYDCYKCKNDGNKNDSFMILNCGHIFHIKCLVEIHFDEFTNCGGIIDDKFMTKCKCMLCHELMEVEDIVHVHNKFTKSTKEQLVFQNDQLAHLDKQMSKLKDEMRTQLEYKQRLEDKRNKSNQIKITLNNLL